ncbi:NADP-dependent malic enzyme [Candidatus Dependentiae bacterium]|nr:NADP-dependent malic enzyme [Candidatus Dependentiae bacterium]
MNKKIFDLHNKGKLEINSKTKITSREILSCVYTPGVAEICKSIVSNTKNIKNYTIKNNTVAVISDGSAVLGLGNIGPFAALPVMEGKCVLFKEFAGVDAFPICLQTQDTNKIIETIINIAPVFGGINLEDISAPRCFDIERQLVKKLSIPVFHDDQHGTAVVVLAALINSLKITNKNKNKIKVFVIGAGAAGSSVINLLLKYGIKNIIAADKFGIIYEGRKKGMNPYLDLLSKKTNRKLIKGNFENGFNDSDVFIGVSAGNIVKPEWIGRMNSKPIVFAMANPTPEILPESAKKAGAYIVGSGRSDYQNQINNVLCFPGIFKGLLKYNIKTVTDKIKIRAAESIAGLVKNSYLSPEKILPSIFDPGVADAVAESVKK